MEEKKDRLSKEREMEGNNDGLRRREKCKGGERGQMKGSVQKEEERSGKLERLGYG